MPYWLKGPTSRVCLLRRHQWYVGPIRHDEFEVTEHCSWCGKTRRRALQPGDEETVRLRMARWRGSERRRKLKNELKYQRARRNRTRVKEIEAELRAARSEVLHELADEKKKGLTPNRDRIRELEAELKGLLFG